MNAIQVLKLVRDAIAIVQAGKELVLAVQEVLKLLGLYKGKLDGVPGKLTQAALDEFKEAEKLTHPGLIGETTAKALIEAVADRLPAKDVPESRLSPMPFMTLPVVGKVTVKTPITTGGNFTWGEATKGLTRRPQNEDVVKNIIKVAKVMEEVRTLFGNKKVIIHSWYRPERVNEQVGGAKFSRHIQGDAVDFSIEGVSPAEVYRRLDSYLGARGGLASSNTFTHIDVRGYKARWKYA